MISCFSANNFCYFCYQALPLVAAFVEVITYLMRVATNVNVPATATIKTTTDQNLLNPQILEFDIWYVQKVGLGNYQKAFVI
jgi:hypothetical protein